MYYGADEADSYRRVAYYVEAARKEGLTNVETRVMNADNLALDADSFDAVICRIALMLFPNPAKALTEMRRVVKPRGKVAVIVHSVLEKNPYHGVFFQIVRRLGNIPPLQRRENPGCTHWEIQRHLKMSMGGLVF